MEFHHFAVGCQLTREYNNSDGKMKLGSEAGMYSIASHESVIIFSTNYGPGHRGSYCELL